jgi:hypothetical protein
MVAPAAPWGLVTHFSPCPTVVARPPDVRLATATSYPPNEQETPVGERHAGVAEASGDERRLGLRDPDPRPTTVTGSPNAIGWPGGTRGPPNEQHRAIGQRDTNVSLAGSPREIIPDQLLPRHAMVLGAPHLVGQVAERDFGADASRRQDRAVVQHRNGVGPEPRVEPVGFRDSPACCRQILVPEVPQPTGRNAEGRLGELHAQRRLPPPQGRATSRAELLHNAKPWVNPVLFLSGPMWDPYRLQS